MNVGLVANTYSGITGGQSALSTARTNSENAKFSFTRYKQSEHFFVFWEAGFGPDPNAISVPQNLRVDIDDLLEKAEIFYETYVTKDNFSNGEENILPRRQAGRTRAADSHRRQGCHSGTTESPRPEHH